MGKIEQCVEALCNKGCQFVREDISRLQAGEILPETGHLTDEERQSVLEELQDIMAVYGDTCRIDFS